MPCAAMDQIYLQFWEFDDEPVITEHFCAKHDICDG